MPQPKQALSVKELAAKLNAEPRALRSFLRRTERAVGKGARYEFDQAQVRDITKAWTAAQAPSVPQAAGPSEDES